MAEQWLQRRGEKEQKGIGDDRLEKTVSGRYRGREAKRGYWRASGINLKALQVAREETDIKGYPTFLYASDCRTSGTSQTERQCKPQRRATAVGSSSGSVGLQYGLIYSGLGGVGDGRARCNTDVSHQNSQTDNVGAKRAAVTGLLHILARTSKRALRLPEIQPRVSGKRG
ncbi:hypothetical protein ALC57_08759 [Trachymyrmex cornetzi]|uniref:Uncharacterized protein n=1 Tax=Trachymyrmex cornetzi TaxID=471704 RepID=A0A195E1E0_9HYME|nr:hypothetical protein ALC57_08759 [Trachymyrmex cornetzi]